MPYDKTTRRDKPSTATSSRSASSRSGGKLEVQIHPGNIRRRVRYLFFTRRQLVLLTLGAILWLLFVGAGLAMAPTVIKAYMARHEHRALEAERERHGERLSALVARMEGLEERSEELRLRVDKIFLAYGLPSDESMGQGGFPAPVPRVPRTVHANVIQQGYLLDGRLSGDLAALGAFLDEIHSFEAANQERVTTTPSACPLTGDRFVLTSPFGNRRSPFTKNLDFHAGIDFAAPRGTSVLAPADGVVVFAGRYPLQRSVGWWRYGNLVVLAHGDDFRTLFGHCDEIRVQRGQRVRQGEEIATVGNTGWSTSPHLHYEVRRRNEQRDFEPVDPRIYILDRRWRDEERLLVRARSAPGLSNYEPLPQLFTR